MAKLTEGDIIEIKEGHEVYAHVPMHFLYSNKKGSFKTDRGHVKIAGELSYLAGKYVVYKTSIDGGGTGHGPHDVYPDGHHVFCEAPALIEVNLDAAVVKPLARDDHKH